MTILPCYVIVGISDRKRSEPGRDDDEAHSASDELEVLDGKKEEKNSEDIELRVICHVPTPEHALESRLIS